MKNLFFTFSMLALLGGANAYADVREGGVVYDVMSNGDCLVVNYDTNTMPEDGNVVIQKTVNINGQNYTVSGVLGGRDWDGYYNGRTGDSRGAFYGCTGIKTLTFEDGSGVAWIGDHAFNKCSNLVSVTFPDGLTTLKDWSFEATAVKNVDFSNTQLQSLYKGAFYHCENLETAKFPSSVKSANDGLWDGSNEENQRQLAQDYFEGCTSLKDVNLSETQLITFGDAMFKGCTALTTVKLPSTLKNIWSDCFNECI